MTGKIYRHFYGLVWLVGRDKRAHGRLHKGTRPVCSRNTRGNNSKHSTVEGTKSLLYLQKLWNIVNKVEFISQLS